ncbi:hypothetical protein OAG11_00625 [Verrucomicrobia bacterium]|nr:hypothetical protein [Verrucomicrobiota bacterium]
MNYKDTLNLPQTGFPMKADLVKREPQRLQAWEQAGLYDRIIESRRDREVFLLHDGPPLRQWGCPHRHGWQQDPQGFHPEIPNFERNPRALRTWLGLPWITD